MLFNIIKKLEGEAQIAFVSGTILFPKSCVISVFPRARKAQCFGILFFNSPSLLTTFFGGYNISISTSN